MEHPSLPTSVTNRKLAVSSIHPQIKLVSKFSREWDRSVTSLGLDEQIFEHIVSNIPFT